MSSKFGRRAEIIDAIEKRLCRIKRKNLFTNDGVPDDDYHFDIALVQKDFPHISSLVNTGSLSPDRASTIGSFEPSAAGINQAAEFIKTKYKTLPALFLQYGNLGSVNDREETVGPNPHLGSSRFTNINQLEERLVIVIRGILGQHACKVFRFRITDKNSDNSENSEADESQQGRCVSCITLRELTDPDLCIKLDLDCEPCTVDCEPYNSSPEIAQIHFKVEIPCETKGSFSFTLKGTEEAKISGNRDDCDSPRKPLEESLTFSAQDENSETYETKVTIDDKEKIKTIRKNSQKYFYELDKDECIRTIDTNILKEDDIAIIYQDSSSKPTQPTHNDDHWDGTVYTPPNQGQPGRLNKWILDTLPSNPTNLYACLVKLSTDKNTVVYSDIIDLTDSNKVPSDPSDIRFIYRDTPDDAIPTGGSWDGTTFNTPTNWEEDDFESIKENNNPKVAVVFLGSDNSSITYSEPLERKFNTYDYDNTKICTISSLPIPLTTLVSMLHADVNKALFEPKKNNLLETRTAAGLIKQYYENGFPEDDANSEEELPPKPNGERRLYPDDATKPHTALQKLRRRVDNLIQDKNKIEQPADLSLGINGVEDFVITDWFTMEGIGTPYELIDFRLVVWHIYPKGSSI